MATIAPIHPGEVLLEEFLVPLEVTQHRLAVSIGVPPRRINEIVHGKRRITADTALRLARYFATTDRFWLNLQTRYDLEIEKDHLGGALEHIQPLPERLTRERTAHNAAFGTLLSPKSGPRRGRQTARRRGRPQASL